MKKILLLGVCLTQLICIHAQFEKNYTPINFTGKIPDYFLISAKDKTKEDVSNASSDGMNEKAREEFYSGLNYDLKSQLLSGNVFFNDPLTIYLNQISDKLMAGMTNKNVKIRFFATRFSDVNAVCWGEGTILVNIGLLSRLNNEAELAFILSHEISHYVEMHSVKSFKQYQTLEKDFMNKERILEALMTRMRFSRENEFEADMKGFIRFAQTDYDKGAAVSALKVLEEADMEKYRKPLNLMALFSSESFKPDTADFLSREKYVSGVANEKIDALSNDEETKQDISLDSLATHPSLPKRIESIQAKLTEEKSGNLFLVSDQQKFAQLKIICDFEQIETYNRLCDFPKVLYLTLEMLEIYPDNVYLYEKTANALYQIAYYKKIDSYSYIADNPFRVKTYEYAAMLHYIQRLNESEAYDAFSGWLQKALVKFPDNGEITIALAKLHTVYRNSSDAKKLYKAYEEKNPKGPHIYFVKNQLGNI